MSRPHPEPGPPAGPVEPVPDTPQPAAAASNLRQVCWPFIFAVTLAVAWYVVLMTTAVTTANPDIVNRFQIESSVLVVAGTVSATGDIDVEQVYRGVLPEQPLKVILPADIPPGRYILPLSRLDGRFEITPARTSVDLRRVYPVSDDALQQLQTLLDE